MAPVDIELWTVAAPETLARETEDLLTADFDGEERQRLERFRFPRDRALYATAHGLLRRALARQLDLAPRAVRFVRGRHGKPELDLRGVERGKEPPLRFSLTHTDGLAACAIARGRDVGVDAERVDRAIGLEIAHRYFSASETTWLGGLPPERAREAFLELWTLKESLLKAIGTGLSVSLANVTLALEGEKAAVEFGPDLAETPADWELIRITPGPHHRLAVAVRARGEPTSLRAMAGSSILPPL